MLPISREMSDSEEGQLCVTHWVDAHYDAVCVMRLLECARDARDGPACTCTSDECVDFHRGGSCMRGWG
jgi:hypothetical protein